MYIRHGFGRSPKALAYKANELWEKGADLLVSVDHTDPMISRVNKALDIVCQMLTDLGYESSIAEIEGDLEPLYFNDSQIVDSDYMPLKH